MTERQRQVKLTKLTDRLCTLESKLYDAECQENEKISRMGWGYGMRHTKCSISTRVSDSIKRKIAICMQQIEELNALNASDTLKGRNYV